MVQLIFSSNDRLIGLKEVRRIAGVGRSYIYEAMSAGTFPKSVKIGPNSVRWIESEVLRWVQDRIESSRLRAA